MTVEETEAKSRKPTPRTVKVNDMLVSKVNGSCYSSLDTAYSNMC
jgi:hypothetical protein